MSTVNPHFTFHYSQPTAYRFSHDSVFLSRKVFEIEREQLQSAWILDLCAGCGIVGLDLLFHARDAGFHPTRVDFLEVQDIYREHFEINAAAFPQARFISGNYAHPSAETYDIIVCNPPYFETGRGKLSPSEFKNRCRFFIDSDFANLMQAIDLRLKPEGRAYVLIHDFERRLIPEILQSEPLEPIRGTPLIRLTKRKM